MTYVILDQYQNVLEDDFETEQAAEAARQEYIKYALRSPESVFVDSYQMEEK